MKKINLFIVVLLILLMPAICYAEKTTHSTETDCYLKGAWTKCGQSAFLEKAAMTAQADGDNVSAVWTIKKNGVFRLYFWKTVDFENGDPNGKLYFSSETLNRIYPIDFSKGSAGWNEIGIVKSGAAGITVSLTGENKSIYASAIMFEELDGVYNNLLNFNDLYKNNFIIGIGVNDCYVNGVRNIISEAAEIKNDSTYVPLRFFSEQFGGSIKWNQETKRAEILYDGKTIVFTLDSDICNLNGEEIHIPGKTYMNNGRLMLPLRAISESFGKFVTWFPSGLVIITDNGKVDTVKYGDELASIAEIIK